MIKIFYGGEIHCIQGNLSEKSLNFILDLLDEYIELVEQMNDKESEKEE
jgi:hypothetical protein